MGPKGQIFFYIFLQNVQDQKQNKSHTQTGQGAENKIEIDGVSCNGPGARENFFDPIQAGQSAENDIEIALVSCTGSGSRAVQAKTK